MPEGPAERGVEALRARGRAGARHAESIDGAELSGSIEPVMAGRHAAAYGFAMTSHSRQGQIAGTRTSSSSRSNTSKAWGPARSIRRSPMRNSVTSAIRPGSTL